MKRWLKARIRSFRSFKEEQEFVFPEGPGLFFLTGKNEEQPRLGANGTGKTTLWEALYWLFNAKTSTGLSATQIAPWCGAKGTRVELDYEGDDGLTYTLGRTWSPNRWYLVHPDGADELLTVSDETNPALSALGLTSTTYLHCILMAQGEPMFLDLKPEAATALFSQVLELDRWLDLSTKASKMAGDADRDLRALESQQARTQGKLDGLSSTGFAFTANEWEQRRSDSIKKLLDEHALLLEKRKGITEKLLEADDRVAKLKEGLRQLQPDRRRTDEQESAGGKAGVASLQAAAAVLEASLKRLRDQCDFIDDNATCKHCGHTLTDKERDEQLTKLLDEEDAVRDELAEVEAKLAEAKRKVQAADAQRTIEFNTSRDLERNLGFAQLDVQSLERELKSVDNELDRIELSIDRLEDEKNPVLEAEARLSQQRQRLLDELSGIASDMAEAERRVRLYTFWVRGFKEIRLEQISEAMTQLEVEVNSCINQLGLVGWRLFFKTDSETKAGAAKRGFTVEVLSPANDKPVPWKSWSGGEAQRLRIAGAMGFANLCRDRLGVTVPLEVWDEPTQYLSPQGVSDLLDGLSQRAQSEGRQIWVVDHRSLGYGAFNGTVTVVKDSRGSRFEEAQYR